MSVYPSNVVCYIVYHVSFLPPVACVARVSTLYDQQNGCSGFSVRNESKKSKQIWSKVALKIPSVSCMFLELSPATAYACCINKM